MEQYQVPNKTKENFSINVNVTKTDLLNVI